MGAVEFAEDIRHEVDMAGAVADGGYFSDEEVVAHVREALQSVALGDREQYEWLLYEVLDPTEKMGPDHEALLVTTLRALSGAVSYIDVDYHRSLYTSIFKMSLWKHGPDLRTALVDLIICLAASGGVYLDGCLDMLVRNFLPPRKFQEHSSDLEWRARKKDVVNRILSALQDITRLVPLTPMRLWPIIIREMPKSAVNKDIVLYVECMLQLESGMIGEFIGSSLLKALVDKLMDLDADISWEEILQEDYSKGVFDMELEDIRENAGDDDGNGKILEGIQDRQVNEVSEKLDSLDCLMGLTCDHLKSCANDGRLVQVFKTLMESFQKTVLNAYKSKFVQFVMFYACSLDPENCGTQFAFLLRETFLSRTNPPLFRMSGVAYLASYLSRAKFVGSSLVADTLESLVDWCFEYCQFVDSKKTINPKVHRVFYSGSQAVMYILCFRMKSLMNDPYLRSRLLHMPLESVLCHPLDPLKVCLPSIVEEFLRQAKAAHLFSTSRTLLFDNSLQSELSKTFGGIEKLDMFFPFDPYLLKESDRRFIRPNFVFWSTVKKAYDDYDSEDDGADEVFEDGHGASLEKTCLADNIDGFTGDQYSDIDSEDDLGLSMDKMSITPKDTFKHHFAGNLIAPARMPARIRPSMSPC